MRVGHALGAALSIAAPGLRRTRPSHPGGAGGASVPVPLLPRLLLLKALPLLPWRRSLSGDSSLPEELLPARGGGLRAAERVARRPARPVPASARRRAPDPGGLDALVCETCRPDARPALAPRSR